MHDIALLVGDIMTSATPLFSIAITSQGEYLNSNPFQEILYEKV